VKFDEYISKDGHSYMIGDTLKIGRPSNNKTFLFITVSSTANALLGVQPEALSVSQSGTKSVIKSIIVGGTKKTGFKIFLSGRVHVVFAGTISWILNRHCLLGRLYQKD
jgi:hypothetical protein